MDTKEREIRQKLKDDFVHYATKCLKIRTKSGKVVSLELNTAQQYIHRKVEEQRAKTGKVRAIVLKGRQQGCSTYIEGRFYWLLDRIVRREGIGDVLANGTYWAAEQIGNGAQAYAHNNIKKTEQLPLKLGMLNPIYFLMYCTGEKINITQIEGNFPQAPFATREEREAFAENWVHVPDERFKQWFVDWELRGERSIPQYPSVDATCEIVDWQEKMHYIDDAIGMCAGLSSFPLKPPYHLHNLPSLVSSGAGLDLDEARLTHITKRNRTLVRAINIRRGLKREDEKPPEDHWKKRFPELEAKLLDEYYKFKGWNSQGVPTQETLRELSLTYVSEDLLARGLLTHDQDGPLKETTSEGSEP